ncbi:MAG: circadian clock protein KaiC [Myxococcales bacterium]|nr:MAG: circadian clock protein KaiC [Myxococcales bacterium]
MGGKKNIPDNPMLKSTPLAKLGTGVYGLDDVLNGGYPDGRTTLLKGGPGAGKTLFSLQFLHQSALKGIPGIFVTFEESTDAIRMNAATLGWDFRALEKKGLLFIHYAKMNPSDIIAGPFSLKALMAILDGKCKAIGAKQLAIDAIDVLMRRFEDSPRVRDELNALHEWLDENRYTCLLSVKSSDDPAISARFSFLDYMADCAIVLDHRMMEQISTRRLRVVKYRGSGFGTNEYPYIIGTNGISLVPIASVALVHRALGPHRSTGKKDFDEALDGGYRRGACILITGPSGAGKTTIACSLVQTACARGEKVLFISYEESPEALESSVRSAGIKLKPALRSGNLKIISRLPERMGADEHLFFDLLTIRSFQPDLVAVDAISACNRMGSGKAPFDYLMRLVNTCKEQGITCVLNNQMRSSAADVDLSGLGFSSLVDTVIQLRFEEIQSELKRSLVVLKARGSKHSPRFHDLRITDNGIVLDSSKISAASAKSERSSRTPRATGGAR